MLQSQLSAVNGAEVNIAEVKLGVIPLQLSLSGIEVTDKETPTENLVEIESARIELSTDSLLKSKFIITDMSVENIRFSTKRSSAGKIFTKTDDEEAESSVEKSESLTTASLEMPDINELMDKAGMQTPAAFDALDNKADEVKNSWAVMEAYIDDKKKWDAYQARYKKIKSDYKKGNTVDRLKAIKALKKLNREIKKDLKMFSAQRKKLKADYAALKAAYKKARQAPNADLNKIKSSYQLDGGGMENISRVLFGENISGYLSTAKKYYRKLQPYLESEDEAAIAQAKRERGRYVHFNDFNPEPDFLIEKAGFSSILASGEFIGSARDITADQQVQNKPSVVELTGKNLKHSKAEDIRLIVDLRKTNARKLNFSYDISGRQVSDYKVAGGDTLPLVMKSAQLDLKSNIKFENKRINGLAEGEFTKVRFSSQRDTSGRNMASIIASSIEKVTDFNVDVLATGKPLKPKLKIKSDIDNKVNKQLKYRFKQIKADYEKEIKAKFEQRYGDKMKAVEDKMAAIDKYKSSLQSRQNALENKLNSYKK